MSLPIFRAICRRAVVAGLAGLLLAACSPTSLIVRNVADELAAQGQASEEDLDLAREASPFYLKLAESVLRREPAHIGLATAVTGSFTQYAYAFVAFDADRLEATDAQGAQRLRQRAAHLYRRAQGHAMTALERQQPGFRAALVASLPHAEAKDWPVLPADQVGLAYWAAAAWGGWVSLATDEPEVVADLPLAARLAQLAWQADPTWGQGALAGLMGAFENSRPGGSPKSALPYFDQAIALGAGHNVGAFVGKAEGYALPSGDRALFEQLLQEALAIKDEAGSPLALSNEAMRRRAAWLLGRAGDLF